ncbi:peptidyl-tRNA hydrolase [Firmicutes bacterium CAG:240]|jgi:PTH1 family peptidyl-tRNA hydrolase|nr:aminoacyl-tRNA hydrolase [Bacillota bacterium]OLA42450.1 MAG: aminoacyl-tRNA hydrolase [Firmicutes bacterium CAG:24053_14]CDB43177.1 peptidyl-tRNA hydrolase [Firmicutes bacterium CAG:240]
MFFSKGGAEWIVAFLGNPGLKYNGTRHNAGFMAADAMEKKLGVSINKMRFKALTQTADIGGKKVLLMKPQTYMNLSGDAIVQAANFYKVPPERVIVVSDETALPIGRLRIRRGGSAGGHNGLKSVIARLGTDQFPRIRLGVGDKPHPDYDMADWVLSAFKGQDAADMELVAKKAADAVECYITEGADRAMNRFN